MPPAPATLGVGRDNDGREGKGANPPSAWGTLPRAWGPPPHPWPPLPVPLLTGPASARSATHPWASFSPGQPPASALGIRGPWPPGAALPAPCFTLGSPLQPLGLPPSCPAPSVCSLLPGPAGRERAPGNRVTEPGLPAKAWSCHRMAALRAPHATLLEEAQDRNLGASWGGWWWWGGAGTESGCGVG